MWLNLSDLSTKLSHQIEHNISIKLEQELLTEHVDKSKATLLSVATLQSFIRILLLNLLLLLTNY